MQLTLLDITLFSESNKLNKQEARLQALNVSYNKSGIINHDKEIAANKTGC